MRSQLLDRGKESLTVSRKNLGPQHPDTLKEMYFLSADLTQAGLSEEAQGILEELIVRTLAPGEHILAISLHNTETPSSDLRMASISLVEVEEPPIE